MLVERRKNFHPTHKVNGFDLRIGHPFPLGATVMHRSVNFSIFSRHATGCTLVLFEKGAQEPFVEIPFPPAFKIGDVYCMILFNIDYKSVDYGYRFDGPSNPLEGHCFNRKKILIDPYAKILNGRNTWGQLPSGKNKDQYKCGILGQDFDWGDDRPPNHRIEDLIIYEMHVRGFTQHPRSNVKFPGSYRGMINKIPYLRELGINCVELMPIFSFDEHEFKLMRPPHRKQLFNYWGYSTVGFFAPKAGFAASKGQGEEVNELKSLIKELHKNDIEVFLDVVFNHTAEGNQDGPTLSMRGIDNKIYYLLEENGKYADYSGCGNTLNCNHPAVRGMVIDCLRYWVAEYHIDGFRFDLASILSRDQAGQPMASPPLIEFLAGDPVLSKCKLIAEAWDAAGLYQVGTFPDFGRWSEWNGKYRDTLRRFLRGDFDMTLDMALGIQGSPDLYEGRGPGASINFITCHDGFSLYDLMSYTRKYNLANGEKNKDGNDQNFSSNYGAEGETSDESLEALRLRQMKNAIAVLLLSQGVPMLLMGDEMRHSKKGNNNTYCQDNELNWIDWSALEKYADLNRFFRCLIQFRKAHPVLRHRHHLSHEDMAGTGYADISWHGIKLHEPDWTYHSKTLAFMLCGDHTEKGIPKDSDIFVVLNMYEGDLEFEIPYSKNGRKWFVAVNTSQPSPRDCSIPGQEFLLKKQDAIEVASRSVVVLIAKRTNRRKK